MRHGFITFPQFLDNGYTYKHREQGFKRFQKALIRYGLGYIQFAVLPDDKPDEAEKCIAGWPDVNWIYPLHKISDDIHKYEWIGFPHREHWRDYSLTQFLELTKSKNRWYLGFWEEKHPEVLLQFHGFDTTLPETYSGVFGKLWKDWNLVEEAPSLFPIIEIFTYNVLHFKIALLRLFQSTKMLEAHL